MLLFQQNVKITSIRSNIQIISVQSGRLITLSPTILRQRKKGCYEKNTRLTNRVSKTGSSTRHDLPGRSPASPVQKPDTVARSSYVINVSTRHNRERERMREGGARRGAKPSGPFLEALWVTSQGRSQVDANVSHTARPPAAVFIAFSGNILRLDGVSRSTSPCESSSRDAKVCQLNSNSLAVCSLSPPRWGPLRRIVIHRVSLFAVTDEIAVPVVAVRGLAGNIQRSLL